MYRTRLTKNRSWILIVHKARISWKNHLENKEMVFKSRTYNGEHMVCRILITSLKLHKAYQTNARLVYSSRSYYTTTSNPLFSQSVRFSSLSFRSRYTMARFSFYYPKIMRPPKSILILDLFQFRQTVLLPVNVIFFSQRKSQTIF